MSLMIDKHTKEQAIEYANTEAEIKGFDKGSAQWKKAFKDYLSFAVGTMSLGRNPRQSHYKVYTTLYPEIFSQSGFAGQAAKNYRRQDGGQEVSLQEVQNRILSSIVNLLKLYENGILEVKNTTTGNKQGKISNKEMSELQFPNKEEFNSKEEYQAAVKDVIYNWFVRDMVTNCILESLSMFWSMTKEDVEKIMAAINIEGDESNLQNIAKGREQLIKRLRTAIGPSVQRMNYRKILFSE